MSVNAASLALVDAGVAMSDLVVACSAGYLDGMPVMVSFFLSVCVLFVGEVLYSSSA